MSSLTYHYTTVNLSIIVLYCNHLLVTNWVIKEFADLLFLYDENPIFGTSTQVTHVTSVPVVYSNIPRDHLCHGVSGGLFTFRGGRWILILTINDVN